MKPSSQYRSEIGDGAPLQRGPGQLISGISATPSHLVYLTPHHQSHHGPSYPGQSVSGNTHPTGRAYHGHHIEQSHELAGVPQRRRTSGHRLSLLRDIGERDRAESSANSALSHGYTTTSPIVYGGRPTMTMMSSLGGLQQVQKQLPSGSLSPQQSAGGHRHAPSTGQHARSSSLHSYSGTQPFLLPGPTIKSEPGMGGFIKEEGKPSMHAVGTHFSPQLMHPTFQPLQPPMQGIKSEQIDKEVENMPKKESLLQSMEKVDKELHKVHVELKSLERKKQQLENAAKRPSFPEKAASPKKVETKHKDLWQVIYTENKRKAEAAKGLLDFLCPRYAMPLYNQPSDTEVYQENLKKHEVMRPKLLAYFQRRNQLSNIRERYLCTRYDQLMTEWQRKTESLESDPKRKNKDAKVREFFEKQFPEIRKQREQHERFTRSGTRGDACRSEADFNEIVDGLSEQEQQEQHMRQLAVVPPMLLDREERRLKFINNNGLVSDPMEDYKKQQELDHWSAQEKQIFKEKYIQHPKNFQMIATFLEKKTVNDCVLFYYLSKKSAGYKGLVRKNSLKPRKVKPGRGHSSQQSSTAGGSGQEGSKSGQISDKVDKDSEQKGESVETVIKEEEVERIDRPPSPRVTRSKNRNLNWTDDDIAMVKEGFSKHGKDFSAISKLFASKTEHQVKNFYNNYKKKHNLDQLISDGKKRKPEVGRRTRTQTPASEASSTSPIDEVVAKDENRPKSTDPELQSSETADSAKKRKKDNNSEKKDEQKSDAMKKSEVSTTAAPADSDSSKPVSTNTSQIRTRRSTGVTNNSDSNKSLSSKRAPDAPAPDEPADKKPKRSKGTKEAKVAEVKDVQLPEQSANETSLQVEPEEENPEDTMMDSSSDTIPLQTSGNEAAIVETTATMTTTMPPAPTTTVVAPEQEKPVLPLDTSGSDFPSMIDAQPVPTESEAMATSQPAVITKASEKVGHRDNDGDSSATCSADEEPNSNDVEPKSVTRNHADSPYAFEDDSSASIILETKRLTMPLTSTVDVDKNLHIQEIRPPEASRPASTHAPQQIAGIKHDISRPQSLPPQPGAVPIGTLTFNPPVSIKANLDGSHAVGRVPEESEFRNALQSTLTPSVPTSSIIETMPRKESYQTIDLTGPTISESTIQNIEGSKSAQAAAKPPHYHPVPPEVASLQKDFSASSKPVHMQVKEEVQRPREYTKADITSMKDRAAVIPIPVSSLRAPMPGQPQRKEPHAKETSVPRTDMPGYPRLMQPSQSPVMQNQTAATIGRSIVMTSSIPTKFVTGSMTTGAPVRQNPMSRPGDLQRKDVIVQSAPELPRYTRMQTSESLQVSAQRAYLDQGKSNPQLSRGPIVKVYPGSVPSGAEVPEDPLKKGKPPPGSIMTGMPVHRPPEERTETILGKQVIVKPPYPRASPVPDYQRKQEAHVQALRYQQQPQHPLPHPSLISGMPPKVGPSTGSILDGTPVVKRKPSEESNSSLSPSATHPPYPTVIPSSRPSPTHPPHLIKQHDRRQFGDVERISETQRGYPQVAAEKMKKEEPFHAHRQTPDKMIREPTTHPSLNSPSHRQHPTIKKEAGVTPPVAEEMLKRSLTPYEYYQLTGLPAPGNLQHIPLTSPAMSPDLLELFRQYGRAGGVTGPPVYPLIVNPGIPAYPPGLISAINPVVSLAPGSPQNDDTSKLLSQDFKTAQLMLRQPPSTSVPAGISSFSIAAAAAALSAPAIGVPNLMATAQNPYHALATPYAPAAGLPVERINFIPGHPPMGRGSFSPHITQPSGRSSVENRSPSHKPPNSASPDPMRHRNRSGENPREFTHHPAVKERNSPSSPYRSQRDNISPQRYSNQTIVSQQQQLSPTHLQSKQYRHHPHHSTSPVHHQRQITKSPHVVPHPSHHVYPVQDISRLPESHLAYPSKLNRAGSGDISMMQKYERTRPESAGPPMRSLPQSPNEPVHSRQHSDSLKYRPELKQDVSQPPYLIPHDQKGHSVRSDKPVPHPQDERPVRRESPRPKQPNDAKSEIRFMSHHVPSHPNVGYPPSAYSVPSHKRESQSPYRPPKERTPESLIQKDQGHHRSDRPPSRPSHEMSFSNNPREDLKNTGRAKMKASSLIDHIINVSFPTKTDTAKQSVQSSQVHDQPKMTQSKPKAVEEQNHEKREIQTKSPRIREMEKDSRHAMPFVPATRHPHENDRPLIFNPLAGPHSVTLAMHSADLIDQYYRQEKKGSPSRTGSPAPKQPAPATEPISPPEKHIPSKPEPKAPPKSSYSQYHQPSRPMTLESRPRVEAPPVEASRIQNSRPALAHPGMQPIASAGASLEDIIRVALMTTEGSSVTPSDVPASNPDLRYDMFISHAALASSFPRNVAQGFHNNPVITAPKPPPATQRSDDRRGGATTAQAQAQSGSEKYVSALLFRQPASQTPQSVPGRPEQPFYQPARSVHNMPAASRSPAPPEGRPIINRPQFEELSDSDD